MAIMKSLCPSVTLADPQSDYKSAVRIEQYRMGEEALYMSAFPGTRYLPFAAIRRAWARWTSITLTGCCGKTLPVMVLRVEYEGGFFQNFTFEKEAFAQQALQRIREHCPGIPMEPPPPKAAAQG